MLPIFLLIFTLTGLLLAPLQAQVKKFIPPRIIETWTEPNNGEPRFGDPVYACLIDQGKESNIGAGDELKVYRERVFAPDAPPMRFFIGTLVMREVRLNTAIGLFIPNDSAINRLMIRFRNAMVDDLVAPQLILEASLLFDSGKAELKQGADDELNKVASFIEVFAPHKLVVEGHTDSDGRPEDNQVLSEERALSVREYLVAQFAHIQPAMVDAVGYGEDQPRVENSTPENKARNRRIEFVVID